MNTQQIIEVLKECKSIYARFTLDYCYQPDPTDRKLLAEFKLLFERGVFKDAPVLQEADLGDAQAIWLVGYTANHF